MFTDSGGIDWLAVGLPRDPNSAIQLFKNNPLSTSWDYVATLQLNASQSSTKFGTSITMTETSDGKLWVFAGAPKYNKHTDSGCDGPNTIETDDGIVEVYMSVDGINWGWIESMQPQDCYSKGEFGFSLDSSNNKVAIGSIGAITCGADTFGTGGGYVAVYDIALAAWVIENQLIASFPTLARELGTSVSIAGDLVVVGDPLYATDGQVLAYVLDQTISEDCDNDGQDDALQICLGNFQDCNGNGIIDSCDISSNFSQDCSESIIGVPDECEIQSGTSLDCNNNGVPDECEIASNPLIDCDGNDIIDACEYGRSLFVTFIIDGSGSISGDDFTLQKEAIKRTICDTLVYSEFQILVISVIQFSSGTTVEIPPAFVDLSTSTAICDDILSIGKKGGSTTLAPALLKAQSQFQDLEQNYSRELVILTDAGLSDWQSAKSTAISLRTMLNPVRICTVLVTPNSNCDLPGQNVGMHELANTASLDLPLPDDTQPQGYFVCLTQADELVPLCENCISPDPHGIWTVFNTDCNSNGLLDSCGDCPADAVITSVPSEVDVSDLLEVVGNWGPCAQLYPCAGDLDCDGVVGVADLLLVVSYWGPDCTAGAQSIPRTVQDCLNRYPLGSLQLEKCLELVEYLENQGN